MFLPFSLLFDCIGPAARPRGKKCHKEECFPVSWGKGSWSLCLTVSPLCFILFSHIFFTIIGKLAQWDSFLRLENPFMRLVNTEMGAEYLAQGVNFYTPTPTPCLTPRSLSLHCYCAGLNTNLCFYGKHSLFWFSPCAVFSLHCSNATYRSVCVRTSYDKSVIDVSITALKSTATVQINFSLSVFPLHYTLKWFSRSAYPEQRTNAP